MRDVAFSELVCLRLKNARTRAIIAAKLLTRWKQRQKDCTAKKCPQTYGVHALYYILVAPNSHGMVMRRSCSDFVAHVHPEFFDS